jgi:hypothetical protein
MINFCYDQLVSDSIGHPNLALWQAKPYTPQWREFDKHFPRTIPLRLLMYFDYNKIPYTVSTVNDAPVGSYYPIGISWFDFSFNYISQLATQTIKRIVNKEIKLLFYYHEGDNPARIKTHLDSLCLSWNISPDCYMLISANSAADNMEQCIYFQEHEHFFRVVNQGQVVNQTNLNERRYVFTMLNRTHKWWRAGCVTDLLSNDILKNSQWSYATDCTINDDYVNCPIKLYQQSEWKIAIDNFIKNGPYRCDDLDLDRQNNHRTVNLDLYTESYFQIVTETHFDADQSGGVFITEKTYKPIKFGQPFIVIGTPGILKELRAAGYRTFDSVLDNTYDTIEHNTRRWLTIRDLLKNIQNSNPHELFMQCQRDIEWNKEMFNRRQAAGLNILTEKLTCKI